MVEYQSLWDFGFLEPTWALPVWNVGVQLPYTVNGWTKFTWVDKTET